MATGKSVSSTTGKSMTPVDKSAGIQPPSVVDAVSQAAGIEQEDAKPVAKPPVRLGEKLVNLGLISDDQLQIVLTEQKTSKKLFGAILVEMGFITESALGEVLAESSGTEKFDPKSTMLDSTVVRRVPKEIATRHKAILVGYEHDIAHLAMADVYNVLAIDQVRRHLPRNTKIIPTYCTESEILELIDQYYDYEISVDGILREIETGIRDNTNKLDGRQEGYVNPTVRLVNALLVDAIKQGASDIHLEPEGTFLRLRYRIDGAMVQVRSFHRDYWSAMAVRIKIMSGMNIAETRNPQDGRISYNVLGREVDFRVATQPTVHGENIVMRLLDKAKSLVPLESLGFSDHNIEVLKKMIKRPEGIIIMTGPTGSGKTTTLYSILSYINNIDTNIMTLEDPVEYQLPLIRQSNVREGTGMDFLNGIKSLMRQDPDIIFVGEVRDEDTALMAVRAALTGHQVYTTLHTNDALGAIPRLGDIGVPAHLLSGSLIGCLAQRLARKLCQHCRKPHMATPDECKILGVDHASAPTIYEPGGCPKCSNKGFKGRTGIMEIMRVDKGLDDLIATHATRRVMVEYLQSTGFVSMQMDGIRKVLAGEISLAELISTIDLTDRL
jgi:type IV pilus assembly protein PilB